MGSIVTKRVYEPPSPDDGARVLVDRLWPRGLAKKAAALTLWFREIAPSTTLRRWFGHDPAHWAAFRERYRTELDANPAAVARLIDLQRKTRVTLLYAARDPERNHAQVLAEYLRAHAGRAGQDHAGDRAPPASPVCYASAADGAYMGFAPRDELLGALNVLLEAERAGARVCLRTAAEAGDPALKALVRDIQRDEAHWCGVLTKAVRALGGVPSRKTGAFYDKAMAIADLPDRIAFLNRGQAWVARRLRDLMPKTRDDALHATLSRMFDAHERNIGRVEASLQTGHPAPEIAD